MIRVAPPPDAFNKETDCWNCYKRERATVTHPFTGEPMLAYYCEQCTLIPEIARRLGSDVNYLTPRQLTIAELIADGLTDKDIQTKLNLSHGGLRAHFDEITDRLNLDRTRNLRVQITWLVVDARYNANPHYRLPTPAQYESEARGAA